MAEFKRTKRKNLSLEELLIIEAKQISDKKLDSLQKLIEASHLILVREILINKTKN